jgi:MFS family permease
MSFTGANSALTISSFAMMGSMYFFSQFFQSIQGYSPLISALFMFPMTPFVFASTMISVRTNRKWGTKLTMSLGLLLTGIGQFLFYYFAGVGTPYWQIFLVLASLGVGIGFTMSPATSAVMNSLPPNRAGIGSAMNDTTRQLGGALGIAVLGALMNGVYRSGINQLSGISGITSSMLEEIRGSIQSAQIIAQNVSGETSSLIIQTANQAFINGVREAFLIASIVMALGAVIAWIILPEHEGLQKPVVEALGKEEGDA